MPEQRAFVDARRALGCIELYAPVCGTGGLLGQSTTCCLPEKACWGAWLDQLGNCRGPADGVLPAGCCK